MFWSIFKVTFVILLIIAPIFYFNRAEWLTKKKTFKDQEGRPANEEMVFSAIFKVAPVVLLLLLPVFFLSDPPYAFYSSDQSVIKLAFKHSGRRIVGCEEEALFEQAAERFRRQLKETRGVEMDTDLIADCPRERFPVEVELRVDGKVVIDKEYAPKGMRRDMASYIYERVVVEPGVHKVRVWMNDSGAAEPNVHEIEEEVDLPPGRIALVRFDDRTKKLVIE